MQIKILHKQGKSLRAIACELGCSVNTVRKYRQAEQGPGYRARLARPSKLDPFVPYLRERIAAAAPDWIPATVLWRELRAQGFDGGERIARICCASSVTNSCVEIMGSDHAAIGSPRALALCPIAHVLRSHE